MRGTDLIRALCDSFFALVPPFDLVLRICEEHAKPLRDKVLEKKNEKFVFLRCFYGYLYLQFRIINNEFPSLTPASQNIDPP